MSNRMNGNPGAAAEGTPGAAASSTSAPPRRSLLRRLLPTMVSLGLIGGMVGVVMFIQSLPAKPPPPPPEALPPKLVHVQVVQPRPLVDSFILPGVVEANRVVRVAAEVAGRIEKIHVVEGQAAQAGQPMIELNTDLLQADYDRAKAQSEFDQRDYDRVRGLAERGVATQSELDQSRTKWAASKAAYDAAHAHLERAVIKAPIAGAINTIPVEKGEYVQPGHNVVEIVDVETVKIVVDLPEKDTPWIQLGQEQKIHLDGRFRREIAGKISYICELADARTRTTRVEISVPNPLVEGGRVLRSGQIVRVEMRRRLIPDALVIPLEAVIPQESNGESFYAVYVVEDGRAVKRVVRLGVLKGSIERAGDLRQTQVQIVSGLQAGDRLIVVNQRYVGPGQAVQVVDPTAATTAPAGPPGAAPASQPASMPAPVLAGHEAPQDPTQR